MPCWTRAGFAAIWFAASQFFQPAAAAEAETLEERTIGRWLLVAMQSAESGEALCMVSSQNDRGEVLSFIIQRSDHMWTLGLAAPALPLARGTMADGFEVFFAIDSGDWVLYEAIPIAASRAVVPIGRDIAHMEQFRRGNSIEFDADGQSHSFSLSGSGAALDALSDCAARHLGFKDSLTAEVPTKIAGVDAEPADSYTSVAVGDWFIDALDDPEQKFSACYARPRSAERHFLRLTLNRDGAWTLDVAAASLDLPPATKEVRFAIDDQPPLVFQGNAYSPDKITVEVGGRTQLLDALKVGRRLKATIGDQDLSYDLVGVGPALDALERCAARYALSAGSSRLASESSHNTPAAAISAPPAAEAQLQPRAYEVEEFGQWTVYAFDNERGFSFCVASAAEQNGVMLVFSVDEKDNWKLALRNDDWHLQEGDTYDLRYAVDDGAPVAADGDAPGSSMMRLDLGGSGVIGAFKRGARLRVMAAKATFQFDLAGSMRALSAAQACVARHAKTDRPSASVDPFASEPSSGRNRVVEQRMIGAWVVEAMVSADEDSALCSIKRTNDRDVDILVSVLREPRLWVIALEGHGWQLEKNEYYEIVYTVEGQAPVPARALALSASSMAIPLGSAFIDTDPLRGGDKIVFQMAQGTYWFDLDRASEALDAANDCAKRHLGFAGTP